MDVARLFSSPLEHKDKFWLVHNTMHACCMCVCVGGGGGGVKCTLVHKSTIKFFCCVHTYIV